MLNRILAPMMMLIALSGAGSCSSESSSYSAAVTGDCAITSATLGMLQRTIYATTADGKDTSYAVSVAGSAYPMCVDQLKQEIYNPDSLPVHTDIKKILFSSISSDGTLTWRKSSGNDTLFSANDTIDFSEPRFFTCYSLDGQQQKTYKITVNVHKSASEEFSWQTISEGEGLMEGITEQRLFLNGGKLCVLAVRDGQPVALQADTADVQSWSVTPTEGIGSFAPRSVQLFKGEYYFADCGVLKKSADGIAWAEVDADREITALLIVGKDRIYGIGTEGAYSSADGEHWEADEVDGSVDDFPADGIASVWSPMTFNDNFSYLLLCGTKDGELVVWKKIVDSQGSDTEPWSLFPQGDNGANRYPMLAQSAMLAYDDKIVCAGLNGGELSNFFLSSDGGRSWQEQNAGYNLPANIEAESFSMAADEDNFIWLVCAPSGKLLKGRLNRLSYESNRKFFDRAVR